MKRGFQVDGPRTTIARENRGLTQKELADLMSMSISNISRVESGDGERMDRDNFKKLAGILRVTEEAIKYRGKVASIADPPRTVNQARIAEAFKVMWDNDAEGMAMLSRLRLELGEQAYWEAGNAFVEERKRLLEVPAAPLPFPATPPGEKDEPPKEGEDPEETGPLAKIGPRKPSGSPGAAITPPIAAKDGEKSKGTEKLPEMKSRGTK